MALPKKGLRTIEHGGKSYGWMIRRKPTYLQGCFQTPMTIAIQPLEVSHPKILHVTLNIDRPDNSISPHQTQITPRVIREIIEEALQSGWQSEGGGKEYPFQYRR